jgi:hypothetical protein
VFRRVRGEFVIKGRQRFVTPKDYRASVETWTGGFPWSVLPRRG